MSALDALQWLACAASLLSTYLHGSVNRLGPLLSILCGVLFTAINIVAGLYIVACVSALSAGLNIRNYILWSRKLAA